MKKYIIITADTNDADYVTEKHEITDEQIESIQDMIRAIKNCKEEYNYETLDMINDTDGAEEIYKNVSNFDY